MYQLLAFNNYYQGNGQPVNQRTIYVIVAQGQLVRAYADYKMALQDLEKIRAMKPNVQIADPVPLKLYDNRALGSTFDRLQSSEFHNLFS